MCAQIKQDPHDLFNSDPSILEFIQDQVMDGMWYFDIDDRNKNWTSPKFLACIKHFMAIKMREVWDYLLPKTKWRLLEGKYK